MNISECDDIGTGETSDYIVACIAILFGVLTVIFNLLLILVIKSSKVLHTCTNAFVASIAFSEIIHGTLKMSVIASSRLSNSGVPNGSVCHMLAFLLTTGRTAANFSLMVLSIDRCVAIYKPVKYSSIITPFSTGSSILCVWTTSALIASIPFWGDISYEFDYHESVCLFSRNSNRHHVVTVVFLSTFLPTLIISISLAIIIREARSRHRIFAVATLPIVISNLQPKAPINPIRAMRSLFLIVLSYLIFCIPETVLFIINVYFVNCLPKTLIECKHLWSTVCCISTPIIVTLCNRNYSKRLKRMLCNGCHRHKSKKNSDFSVSTGLHSILEASYTISNFRPIPNNIILLASEASRVHLRNSLTANPAAQSRTVFETPMLRKALASE